MIAAALAELALADSIDGGGRASRSRASEAAALVDSLSDDELAGHIEAAAWLAGVELYLDRYAEGEAHADRALAVARATGQGELFLLLAATLGGLWRQRGKLAEAGELLDGGIEAARLLGNTHALVVDTDWAARPRRSEAGDVELALATAQESVDLSQDAESNFHSAEAAADLAAAPARDGATGTRGRVALEFGGRRGAGAHRRQPESPLPRGARALLARARPTCRGGACSRLPRRPGPRPCSSRWPPPGPIERRRPSSWHAGDPAARSRAGTRVGCRRRRAGAPVEAALSRTLAGRALAQAGERDRAVDRAAARGSEFEACGALRYRDEAERELRKLGHHIHRRTRPGKTDGTGIESLTERELQVARLVVDRKTNPEIAAELFLSQKTVETHLRNIFRKVGRRVARRAAPRRGALGARRPRRASRLTVRALSRAPLQAARTAARAPHG